MKWRTVLVAATLAAMLGPVVSCRTTPTAASSELPSDWDAWPWMRSEIPASMRLTAHLTPDSVTHTTYAVVLTFTNTSADTAEANFGACSFGLRLYADSTATGTPLWDNRPPPNSSCILPLYIVRLGPAGHVDRQVSFFDAAAAAKSLKPGRYGAAVVWRSSYAPEVHTVSAGMISLP